jgi:hypothetical protein
MVCFDHLLLKFRDCSARFLAAVRSLVNFSRMKGHGEVVGNRSRLWVVGRRIAGLIFWNTK